MEMPILAIDRESPIPFYFQLAGAVRDRIDDGSWSAGTRLPSEADLCEMFGVSRSVVRQALGTLEAQGLIHKAKGRGAFVSDGGQDRAWLLQSSHGFFQDEVERHGARVTSRILRADRESLPRWAAEALGETGTDPVGGVLERLRWVDGELALYVVNYLPERLADAALGMKDDESLYERLEARGIRVGGGRRTVTAAPADRRLSELLEVRRGTALNFIESVSWTPEQRPFDCYHAWVRSDRMTIEIRVTNPSGASHGSPDRQLLRPVNVA
jgi:GntR family transcriptional regulator